MDVIVLGGLIGCAIVAAVLKMQRNSAAAEKDRRALQRDRRVGLAPIPGADGTFKVEDVE